jgi:hypothetical protein
MSDTICLLVSSNNIYKFGIFLFFVIFICLPLYIFVSFYKYFENTPKICGSDIWDALNPTCIFKYKSTNNNNNNKKEI